MTSTAQIEANAEVMARSLMSAPDALPLVSACAVAGNGWQENLCAPLTIGPKDHGSDGSLQWRASRLVELQRRKNWDTLPVQMQFFKDECKRDYPSLWAQLVNPGQRTLENLTANICEIYERPSVAGRVLDKRIAYAKRVYALFTAAPTPVTPPAGVPQPVLAVLLALLDNIFGGKASTAVGLLALLYAFVPPLAHDWPAFVVLAVVSIFLVGGKGAPPRHEALPEPAPALPQGELPMALDFAKLAEFAETATPLLEKVVPILVNLSPTLETLIHQNQSLAERLTRVEAELAATQSSADPTNEALSKLIARLKAITPPPEPQHG